MTCPCRAGMLIAFLLLALLCSTAGCSTGEQHQKTVLKVVPAGSLLQPFAEVEQEFEATHPQVDVQIEGHGSIQAIRQVTDLHRNVDVVAVADASLIPDLMFRTDQATGANVTDSYTPFARNAMVIAYTNRSRYADEISQDNWYGILTRRGVRTGFSNPMLDAAGYRTVMVALLASDYYRNATIFPALIGRRFTPPLVINATNGVQTVGLPETMRPSDPDLVIRDGSIYVISLLEAGGIDYAFEYRSVAEGHNLLWIDLPQEIDLSSPAYAAEYGRARVTLGFQRFSAIGKDRHGQPIVYAITIPNTAPNPDLAREFADLVIEKAKTGGKGWPAPLA
ncbi:MAG TPA: tungstate ABC transporter substrate-binding protein WtpA [Methanoregulaceae archaeon]|nr:tungstate ABC transporter substrate-binding protein WtpA [Methanoregulaceae archaeon]HPD76209.1 tungstate ABC transporter substrate-binding protein WtpA [Methanoregulaceae archaeon]HRY76148.1 tungstate ABC transporter substrate-binding protein WtpA [Methanoregulaceae archaeon]